MSKIKKLLRSLTSSNNNNSSNSSSIIPGVDTIVSPIVKEQEVPIFTRKNVLVQEFMGDPPIVYASNFGTITIGREEVDEKGKVYELPNLREDNNTVRMQDQYGYSGKDATKVENEDEYIDEIKDEGIKLVLPENKTASLLTPEQQFQERWNKIKESSNENVIIKE